MNGLRLSDPSRREMSGYTLTSDQHVVALRRRIAAGEYSVNARNVASSIVCKLSEIDRARRVMDAQAADVSGAMLQADIPAGDQTPRESEPTRRGRERRRPGQEPSSR
jgi:hypothetical protein